MLRFPFIDALRRLPVVIGCVVLATTQPMSGSSSEPASGPQRLPETVIYPKNTAEAQSGQSAVSDMGYGSPVYLVFAVVVAAAGAWVLWRRRSGGPLFPGGAKPDSKLQIEETRSLGNRQFLIVAAYEGRKFLIGVTTDKIELLTHLPSSGGEEE